MKQARKHRTRGQLAEAAAVLRDVVAGGDPAVAAEASGMLAEVLEELGDISGARRALIDLLNRLSKLDNEDALIAAAERAVATGDPEITAVAFWARGNRCRARGDVRAAEDLFRQAIGAGHPGSTAAVQVELALLLHGQGETAAAKQLLELALGSRIEPAVTFAAKHLGSWLIEEGDLAGSAEAFARALAGPDSDFKPLQAERARSRRDLIGVARRAHEAGDPQVAARALLLAAQVGAAADAASMAKELAQSCADDGTAGLATARGYYEAVIASGGQDAALAELDLADLLASHGMAGQARAIYERLSSHEDPRVRKDVWRRYIPFLRQQGDMQEAALVARRAAPEMTSSFFSTARELEQLVRGESREGDELLRQLLALEDGSAAD